MCFLSVRAVYELCQGEMILAVANYDYDYVFVIKTSFTLTPAKMFRGTCGYHLNKGDKNCSHLHLQVCTDCTAAAVHSTLLRS